LQDPGSIFISSGTWSLVGVETDHAWVTEAARAANLTNEGRLRRHDPGCCAT